MFRCHDAGRLAEKWIQTDKRNVLRQLGVTDRQVGSFPRRHGATDVNA
jgi:hypothetical protein